ncbi:MAG: RNase adapter RapZ [Gammaproteobacteria bacterium]|nr:RNase adapter RapZ [Gammaproteobacteria bacterium]
MSLIVISGRSGSGKSTALHVLEDMGYYCIDNLPASLLPPLLENLGQNAAISRISVSIDARNLPNDLLDFEKIIATVNAEKVRTQIIYLDSASASLVKRFSETRRKHPLSNNEVGLREAIELEREILEPIASVANLLVDTTNLTIHELRDRIKDRVGATGAEFSLLFESFAYKKGVPVDADIVFDLRCLPNPHWKPELRSLTGRDEAVKAYLASEVEVQKMYNDISLFLERWLPSFKSGNRSYMTVAIGCTGGQHRSVYFCEKLYEAFSKNWSNVHLRHREIVSPDKRSINDHN